MALNHNFLPTTSLVFGVRDYLPQLEAMQKQDREGLQNAFKFATQAYDYVKQRQIADAIDDGDTTEAARLDAQRINNQDPTSMFRWKAGQEQAKRVHDENLAAQKEQREYEQKRLEAEKDKTKNQALQNLKYKIDAQMKPMAVDMSTTDNDIKQWSNTLADLEEQGLSGDVGEEYLNKIWNMQTNLKNVKLPSNTASGLVDNFNTMIDSFDKIEAHGGYGKNREKYLKDIDSNWEQIKSLYEQHGQEVPLSARKAYIEARNKFNKKKVTKKKGVLSKV